MISFLVIAFAAIAAVIACTSVQLSSEGDTHEAAKTVRFIVFARALCFIACVTAIVLLATYEGPR